MNKIISPTYLGAIEMFAYSEKDKTKDRTVPLPRLRLIVNRPRLKPLVAAALFMVFPFSQIAAQQSNIAPYNFTDNRNARFCEVLFEVLTS